MSGVNGGAQAGPKMGRALELARKERGLSLKQVEEATKIRAGYLAELERENFGVLPAVYVQGSLKTYANFLHLDGDAMVRELKRRQAPQEESPHPAYVGSQKDDSLDDVLTAVGGAAGVKSRDATGGEEDARPALIPAGSNGYLYLGSAVVLVLAVAAAALALTMTDDGRPAVSQVREPLISQAPETSPPGAEEDARPQQPSQGDEQRANDEDDQDEDNQDEEADQRSQAEQGQGDSNQAQVPASATASAPAGPPARAPTLARQSGMAPPASPARAQAPTLARQSGMAPPASPARARAPTLVRQSSTAPPASPPATGRPTGAPTGAPSGGSGAPPARDDGGLAIRVRAGGDDLVRITGGPFDD
jgi:transcriptional regulator with XRE-family HTH domain